MVKIVFRIIMILAAAGLVTGGLFLYVNNTGASQGILAEGGRRQGFEQPRIAPEGGAGRPMRGGMLEGFAGPGGHGGFEGRGDAFGGGSILGLAGVLAQAGKIGLVTVLVVGIQAVIKGIQGRRRQLTKPAEAA